MRNMYLLIILTVMLMGLGSTKHGTEGSGEGNGITGEAAVNLQNTDDEEREVEETK